MALLSARQLSQTEAGVYPIDIGDGREILVRRPDLQMMVLQGIIATPMFNDVVKLVGEWIGAANVETLTEDVIRESDKIVTFLNLYCCAAMVQPKAVMPPEPNEDGTMPPPAELPEDTLLVTDLTLLTRKTIVSKVVSRSAAITREVVAKGITFPAGPPSEGTGPDVQEVRDQTVVGA